MRVSFFTTVPLVAHSSNRLKAIAACIVRMVMCSAHQFSWENTVVKLDCRTSFSWMTVKGIAISRLNRCRSELFGAHQSLSCCQ